MTEKKLYRLTSAAAYFGMNVTAFHNRKFEPAVIIDGIKLYDVDAISLERKKRSDIGVKRGMRAEKKHLPQSDTHQQDLQPV